MSKVLVVENDEMYQQLIIRILEREGHSVLVAKDGYSGVTMTQMEVPDLILIRDRLPNLNGWQAAEQIKASVYTRHIPIIMLTANVFESVQQKVDEVGCQATIANPITPDEITKKVATLLEQTVTA